MERRSNPTRSLNRAAFSLSQKPAIGFYYPFTCCVESGLTSTLSCHRPIAKVRAAQCALTNAFLLFARPHAWLIPIHPVVCRARAPATFVIGAGGDTMPDPSSAIPHDSNPTLCETREVHTRSRSTVPGFPGIPTRRFGIRPRRRGPRHSHLPIKESRLPHMAMTHGGNYVLKAAWKQVGTARTGVRPRLGRRSRRCTRITAATRGGSLAVRISRRSVSTCSG